MARGEIRDDLIISIKCPLKACFSTQPLLVKSQPEAFTSRGRFVTDSDGTMASDWRLKTNLVQVDETRSLGWQLI